MKKVFKIIAIICAVAAAAAGIYVICKKLLQKKDEAADAENYVSCCVEDDFVSETVSEDAPETKEEA